MINVFIDGKEGTTGLKIYERFKDRKDINILLIDEDKRKDISARKEFINRSDITFLCLPDDAAREAVSLVENEKVKIIDASTAHRTNPIWTYGFPELSQEIRKSIEKSRRVAVPGCHASGFLAIVYPLVKLGILPCDYPITCTSLTGYSGGGKKMISEYEAENISEYFLSPRQYALTQSHKHLPEMQYMAGLKRPPLFTPVVSNFYSGMQVIVPLYSELIGYTAKQVHEALCDYYKGQKLVSVMDFCDGTFNGYIPTNFLKDRNDMQLFVGGNDERIILTALFDNLGKGASGAAVQCMNIMTGNDETLGLI